MGDFGSRVLAVLERRGLNQSNLAERIGRSPQYVSQLLRSTRKPTRETIQLVADGLGVDPSEFGYSFETEKRQAGSALAGVEGCDRALLSTSVAALREARMMLLGLHPEAALRERMLDGERVWAFEAMAEAALLRQLETHDSRLGLATEHSVVNREGCFERRSCLVVKSCDGSALFADNLLDALDRAGHQRGGIERLSDLVRLGEAPFEGPFVPFGSVTSVREGRIVFSVLLEYLSGEIYLACDGVVKAASVDICPDPESIALGGRNLGFGARRGDGCVSLLGDEARSHPAASVEEISKRGTSRNVFALPSEPRRELFHNLGFQDRQIVKGTEFAPGPARILFLSDAVLLPDAEQPALILSNGERICDWLGWLAFAAFSRQLAVFELSGSSVQDSKGILCAPPQHYSLFEENQSEGLRINFARVRGLENPGKYRGAIAITCRDSIEAMADLSSRQKCRQLLPASCVA